MPEGHVIHRLAHELNHSFAGHRVRVTSPQGRFASEAARLDGSILHHAEAWGKHLFITFDVDAPANIVYIHLGLIGKLKFEPADVRAGQIRLHIEHKEIAANLRGPQWCRLVSEVEMEGAVAKLGADPLREHSPENAGKVEAVKRKVLRSSRPIGALLMDQKLFAGVGNIYRAETLFRLGISPFLPGNSVQLEEFDTIWADLTKLMKEGVVTGRIDTVAAEHTPEAMGRAPRKDDHGGEVYVYRRLGQPCHKCETPIAEMVMEGRNLFWCPTCQQQ